MKKPFVKQLKEFDCGLASVMMLLLYFQKKGDLSNLFKKAQQQKYLSLKDLSETLLASGIANCGIYLSELELDEFQDFPLLVSIKNDNNHFAILYGKKGDYFLLADPQNEKIEKIEKKEFMQVFTGKALLIQHKSEKIKRKISRRAFLFLLLSFLEILLISLLTFSLSSFVGLKEENNQRMMITALLCYSLFQLCHFLLSFIKTRIILHFSKSQDAEIKEKNLSTILDLSKEGYQYFSLPYLNQLLNDGDNIKAKNIDKTIFILGDFVLTIGSFLIVFYFYISAGIIILLITLPYIFLILSRINYFHHLSKTAISDSQAFLQLFHKGYESQYQQDPRSVIEEKYQRINKNIITFSRLEYFLSLLAFAYRAILSIALLSFLILTKYQIKDYFIIITLLDFFFPSLNHLLKLCYSNIDYHLSMSRLSILEFFSKK